MKTQRPKHTKDNVYDRLECIHAGNWVVHDIVLIKPFQLIIRFGDHDDFPVCGQSTVDKSVADRVRLLTVLHVLLVE